MHPSLAVHQQFCISMCAHSCWSGCSESSVWNSSKASLQVSRNQEWAATTSSHPWHTECLSTYQKQNPEESTVQPTHPAYSSGYSQCTCTNATCQSRTCTQYMSNLLKKASPKKWKWHILRKPLGMATQQSTPHLVEIPIPKGIHHVEQIWHSITATGQEYCQTEEQCPTLGTNCHKGVVFQTIKSFIHALGIYLQMTEATTK